MASPRDKTAGSAEWLRKRVDRLLVSPEVLTRLKAIKALQDERRWAFDLSRELTRGTGKTWKALAEFPNRLERLAEEVKRINKADRLFYARRRDKDLGRFKLLRLQEQCMQLPVVMRIYAEALRERNATVTAATPRGGRSEGLCQLTELVKLLTGAYHDQEVSELLNAVAAELGERKAFDAIDIAQARSRCKKKKT